jgi:hypothetical protein
MERNAARYRSMPDCISCSYPYIKKKGGSIMKNMRKRLAVLIVLTLVLTLFSGMQLVQGATVYNVGPGQTYANIIDVPWESLNAGDTVNIYYRPTPYKEKICINRQGTAAAPITIHGVPDANGNLPVLDGDGAVSRLALDFGSEARGIIQLCTTVTPVDVQPQYIIIENLEIKNGHTPYQFTDDSGVVQSYNNMTAGVWILKGDNITVRNCKIHDCGNGITTYSGDSYNCYSRNSLIEGNYIYNCGNTGSGTEHNTYTESIGMTYQYNRMGNPLAGAGGNNLKDRSAALVIRYNWIEGGNKQLDLVDGEDSDLITSHPEYNRSFVYGNVLIEPVADGNYYFVNYGGDQGGCPDKAGPLYFYNNTCITNRTDKTVMVRMTVSNCNAYFTNNVMYNSAGTLCIVDGGIVNLSHNWLKTGWKAISAKAGTVNNDGTNITGSDPGFVDLANKNYNLAVGSPCIDAGGALNPAVLPANDLVKQYVAHQSYSTRTMNGTSWDIGAFEY